MTPALQALSAYPQFVLYRAVSSGRRTGKIDKIPITYATKTDCNALDPQNWLDMKSAEAAVENLGSGYGIGFVLTDNDPFFCLDIDDCYQPDNNSWSPFSWALTRRFPGAAVEVSHSKKGLHIWGRYTGAAPVHRCRNDAHGIELYTGRRFIALGHPGATGDASVDCTLVLPSVIGEYFPPTNGASPESGSPPVSDIWTDRGVDPEEDDALITRMLDSISPAAAFGSKASFAQLWHGDADALSGAFPDSGDRPYDESRADAALAAHLAYWTNNDCERIKRLMIRSALNRDKYDREDYLRRTILNGCRLQAPSVDPGAETVKAAGTEWPNPDPIGCSLLPVKPFSDDLLPAALRPWVADIAERMQCPPDFPAVGAMVALSSVIGRKVSIRPKQRDDWQVFPNLWGGIVGRPGVMKSPALSEVMKPLDRLSLMAADHHAEAMRNYEIKMKLSGMSIKAAQDKAQGLVKNGKTDEAEQLLAEADGEDLPKPALRRHKVTDASLEALGEILMENPWGILAYRDELSGMLHSLDKDGQEGARAFYLQGYDGNQGYTFDRIGRGRNLHIPAVCIALLGGIQPGKLQAYVHDAISGGAGDDGLLQRFGLLVWPDIGTEWRNVDRRPNTPAKQTAFEAFSRLDAMTPGIDPETGEPGAAVYRFSQAAQPVFENWRQALESTLRSDELHPALESHLSKYRKLVPAISLICALADGETEVSLQSLQRAIAWSEYLRSHAERTYAAGMHPTTDAANALLKKIKSGKVANHFKPSDIYLKGWAHLGTPETANAAIALLCERHHLRLTERRGGNRGGRPSITYEINPASLARE